MQIWIDADACPKQVKLVLFRAAERMQITTTLVANHPVSAPRSRVIAFRQVPLGFDVADQVILDSLQMGDLVITADVPLADKVLAQGANALNPRGTFYTHQNIKDHLARRDMREELRGLGEATGGPNPLGKKDVRVFANALDSFLARVVW